jgi:hypothetical protein
LRDRAHSDATFSSCVINRLRQKKIIPESGSHLAQQIVSKRTHSNESC